MIPFVPTPDGILVTLEPDDLEFLSQLPEFLDSLGSPEDDPAAARLRVPVYLDDPDASAEWWRLMESELGQARIADRSAFGLIVEAAAAGTTASTAEAEAFLRVLNEGRLALAARLAVEVEEDYERLSEADRGALDYLASLQQLLLAALGSSVVDRGDDV
ncbi:MAG TPA: DUF2017 family protein [Acidimicrobiia bacterium]